MQQKAINAVPTYYPKHPRHVRAGTITLHLVAMLLILLPENVARATVMDRK